MGMRSKQVYAAAIAVSLAGMGGCGSSTIHKQARVDGIDTLSIDAKQRLMLVGYNPFGRKVTCLEPSPDALVARAAVASAAGSGTPPGQTSAVNVGVAAGSTESAASIGLRTPTIQLMRDGYFRLCEGLMNGVIDEEDYFNVVTNIDAFMSVIMAIDAIGGFPTAPGIAISAGSISGSTGTAGVEVKAGPGTFETPKGTPAPDKAQAEAIRNIVKDYLAYRQALWAMYYRSRR
jgi:hypothetical protein